VVIEKQLRDAALSRTPKFFVVHEHLVCSPQELDLIGPEITFVRFGEGYLADPSMDPIGVYGDKAGNRKYLWRGKWYAEYPLHLPPLLERKDAVGDIVRAMRAGPLTPQPTKPHQDVWRALYWLRDTNGEEQTDDSEEAPGPAGAV